MIIEQCPFCSLHRTSCSSFVKYASQPSQPYHPHDLRSSKGRGIETLSFLYLFSLPCILFNCLLASLCRHLFSYCLASALAMHEILLVYFAFAYFGTHALMASRVDGHSSSQSKSRRCGEEGVQLCLKVVKDYKVAIETIAV